MSTVRFLAALSLIALLSACAAQHRADTAAAAKARMVGYSREQVLACMGPPRKKAHDGATEVWQYDSSNGYGSSVSGGASGANGGGVFTSGGAHSKSFCTVNVVMNNGIVQKINYNGPTSSSIFATDEQCGYAVQNCVSPSLE
jgi:hypothetical protein